MLDSQAVMANLILRKLFRITTSSTYLKQHGCIVHQPLQRSVSGSKFTSIYIFFKNHSVIVESAFV